MPLSIAAAITWIKAEFGGMHSLPATGLRPTIRFQRNIAAWQTAAWDVQVASLNVDERTWTGTAKLIFSKGASPNMGDIKKGEPIELLDSYRVIGVGVILAVEK